MVQIAGFLAHDAGQNDDLGSAALVEHEIDDFLHRVGTQYFTRDRTMRRSNSRKQQSQIVGNFRDGAYRGARALPQSLLLDRNGGRQPLNAPY